MIIAAYCRVSTDKAEQLDSLNQQKAFFTEYARRYGYTLFRLYADEGVSGTSLKRREQFNRLMQDARKGQFQAVVVKDVSRLARNTVDFLISIRELKALGINTIFLTANMDAMGDSEFILTLFSAMAQEESSNLSKRVKFGKRINAEKGRVPQRLFGYDRMDNFTLAVNPREAGVVRKIYMLYNEQGLGCRSISRILNQDGDETKTGNDWNPQGVRRILTNPIYKGTLVNHKYEIQDFLTGKQIPLPREEHFIHQRPEWAIITEAVYEKAQAILESRRIQYASGEPCREGRYSSRHLFSTLIKCEHCGRSFIRKTYTYANTRVYWHCATNDQYSARYCDNTISLNEPELIRAFKEFFSGQLSSREDFVRRILSDLKEKQPHNRQPEESCREMERKRKKLLTKKDRYQEMFANGLLTLPELEQKHAAVTEELRLLAQHAAPSTHLEKDPSHHYTREIQRFLDLETMTNVDIRRILDHISVNRNGCVKIVLKRLI